MQDERLVGEFTHQAESFNASEAANARRRSAIERLLAKPPPRTEAFRVEDGALMLRWWAGRFKRPAGPSPG